MRQILLRRLEALEKQQFGSARVAACARRALALHDGENLSLARETELEHVVHGLSNQELECLLNFLEQLNPEIYRKALAEPSVKNAADRSEAEAAK